MRRLMLVVIAAGMISLIPSSAHAYQCVWFVPGEDSPYPGYNRVFTGEVLENEFPHRPVLLVDTVLRGMKLKAGSVIQLRLDGWWPPHLMKGRRYTVPAHHTDWTPTHGQEIDAKLFTSSCAQITDPIDPGSYGMTVIDSRLPPSLSRYR
jgi:hypothetical protein